MTEQAANYYQQCGKVVSGYVECWKTDYTEHDRLCFEEKDPARFLYGIRPAGTNVVVLDNWQDLTPLEAMNELEIGLAFLISYPRKHDGT